MVDNIQKVLDTKTAKDFPDKVVGGSNLIEPTEAMVEQVFTMLVAGDSFSKVKRTVKKKGTNLTLSFGQIKEIHKKMCARKVELKPKEVEVIA